MPFDPANPNTTMDESMMASEVGGAPAASARSQGGLTAYGLPPTGMPQGQAAGGAPQKFNSPEAYSAAVEDAQRKQRLTQLLAQFGLPNDPAIVSDIFVGNKPVPDLVGGAAQTGPWPNRTPVQSGGIAPQPGLDEGYDQHVGGAGFMRKLVGRPAGDQ